ncbi:MAG: hypothetical protein GY947_05045 [Rhodobacteraceae bacterium]|nr:hypothetical protein [Paracoccaceae bacterium]
MTRTPPPSSLIKDVCRAFGTRQADAFTNAFLPANFVINRPVKEQVCQTLKDCLEAEDTTRTERARRIRAVLKACAALQGMLLPAEALLTLNFVPGSTPSRTRIELQRLQCLAMLRDEAGFLMFAKNLRAQPDLQIAQRQHTARLQLEQGFGALQDAVTELGLTLPDDPAGYFETRQRQMPSESSDLPERQIDWLRSRSRHRGEDRRTYSRALHFGKEMKEYCQLVRYLNRFDQCSGESGNPTAPCGIHGLAAYFRERTDPLDVRDIEAELSAGRTVILTTLHVSLMGSFAREVHSKGLPLIHIARLRPGLAGLEGSTTYSTLVRPHLWLPKIVKIARKTPQVILIAADGPDARQEELIWSSRNGISASTSVGLITLAHHNRARFFLGYSHWQQGRITHHLARGPRFDPDKNRENFTKRWMDFYLGELDLLLQGPPENLGALQFDWAKPPAGFSPTGATVKT